MQERFQLFTVLITKLSRSIKRIKTAEMEEFNLKSPHVSCMYYIYKYGGLTLKQLCDICEEDKASISRSIDYLEQVGLVVPHEERKYKNPIELTEKGKQVGKAISHKIDNILDIAGEGISEEERKIMYKSLARISEKLDKMSDK